MGMGFLFALFGGGAAWLVLSGIHSYQKHKQQRKDDIYGTYRMIDPLREQQYAEEEKQKLLAHDDRSIFGANDERNSETRVYLERHPEAIDELAKIKAAERIWEDGYRSSVYVQTSPIMGDHRVEARRWFNAKVRAELPCGYDLLGLFAPDNKDEFEWYENYDEDGNAAFEPLFNAAIDSWERRVGRWGEPSLLRTYFEMCPLNKTGENGEWVPDAFDYIWVWVSINVWQNWSHFSDRERPSRAVFLDRLKEGMLPGQPIIESSPELYTCQESKMLSNIKIAGPLWDRAVKRWQSI